MLPAGPTHLPPNGADVANPLPSLLDCSMMSELRALAQAGHRQPEGTPRWGPQCCWPADGALRPFVMNTRVELQQALTDYHVGRLGEMPPNGIMPHAPRGHRNPLDD
jgi:hypothetical protein